MYEKINLRAVFANVSAYDAEATKKYINGSPHIKHVALKKLYAKMTLHVFESAKKYTKLSF